MDKFLRFWLIFLFYFMLCYVILFIFTYLFINLFILGICSYTCMCVVFVISTYTWNYGGSQEEFIECFQSTIQSELLTDSTIFGDNVHFFKTFLPLVGIQVPDTKTGSSHDEDDEELIIQKAKEEWHSKVRFRLTIIHNFMC